MRRVLATLAVLAAGLLTWGIVLWNTTHFGLGGWLQVHTGTVNEPGPYYGFFSGFGSDLGEFALAGGIATLLGGLWHRFNCHAEGCYRIGIHHLAGGTYTVCRKHHGEVTGHPHRKLSIDHIRQAHHAHLRGAGIDTPPQ